MASKSPLQKYKIDLAMSGLEKLKQEVASVEAKYRILNEDYTVICDEALNKINDARLSHKEREDPESDNLAHTAVIEPELKTDINKGTSLQAICNYYSNPQPDTGSQNPFPHQEGTPAIDCVANCIETGLDKLGDALVFPFVITERIYKKITGVKSTK